MTTQSLDRPPVVVTIRFSLLLHNNKSWNLSRRLDFDDYKRMLFSGPRLDLKFLLFEAVCLPSIVSQADHCDIRLVLLTSSELPGPYRARLDAIVSDYPWITVLAVAPDETPDHAAATRAAIAETDSEYYAHVRLDDDDALARPFAARLMPYVRAPFCGLAVSYGMGFAGVFSEERRAFESFWELYKIKSSCGMAFIGRRDWLLPGSGRKQRTAYDLGSHPSVDLRCPTIVDSTEPMFFYSVYESQDTAGQTEKKLKRSVPLARVKDRFSIALPEAPASPGMPGGAD